MQVINTLLLDKVSAKVNLSERLRMNLNFHDSLDAKAQRLLNALQPGTVLPIHRHLYTAETYILLCGKIKIKYYNGNKELTESTILDPMIGNFGINIPAGQWHTLDVLEKDSVIFEVKDGPYAPFGWKRYS